MLALRGSPTAFWYNPSMPRPLLTILSATSLLLSFAILTLWIRNYRYPTREQFLRLVERYNLTLED